MSVYSESQNWASDLQEGDFKKNFEEGDLIISPSSHNSWLVQEIDFDADNFISTLGGFSDKKTLSSSQNQNPLMVLLT